MRRALGFTLLLAAGACGGPGNSLEGSIGESFSLQFDEVQIRKQGTDLLIEYLKHQAGGDAKVVKVVVDTEGLRIEPDAVIRGAVFLARVQVSRVATSGGDFPLVQSGEIRFEDYSFKDGGKVSGELDVLFANGRTLHGNFEHHVKEVPLD